MSTSLIGFRPVDEQFKKFKKIYDACKEADLDPPEEVTNFFDDREPDNEGIKIDLKYPENQPGISEWKDVCEEGFQVDLRKLDPTIKILRFYNSW